MPLTPTTLEESAHLAWEAGNRRRAFRLFLQCAESGSNAYGCMLNVGYFYDVGMGVKQDKQLAMLWYKRAYRLGCSASACNIAALYREMGRYALTYQWYCRAAKLGDGDAEIETA